MSFTLSCVKVGSDYRLFISPVAKCNESEERKCYMSESPCEMMDNSKLGEFIQDFHRIEIDKDNTLRLLSEPSNNITRILKFKFLAAIDIRSFPSCGIIEYNDEQKLFEKLDVQETPKEESKESPKEESKETPKKESQETPKKESSGRCQTTEDMWGRLARIEEREHSVANREVEVSEREDSVAGREIALEQKWKETNDKLNYFLDLKSTLDEKEKSLNQLQVELSQKEKELNNKQKTYTEEELDRISQYIIDSDINTDDMGMLNHTLSILNKEELLELFVNNPKYYKSFGIIMLSNFNILTTEEFKLLIEKYNCAPKLFDAFDTFRRSYNLTTYMGATVSAKCMAYLWTLMTNEEKESKEKYIRDIVSNYALKLAKVPNNNIEAGFKNMCYWTQFMNKCDS